MRTDSWVWSLTKCRQQPLHKETTQWDPRQKQRARPVFSPTVPAISPPHFSPSKILVWVCIQDIQLCHGLPICKWLYQMLLIIEFVYSLFYWELSSGNVTSPLDGSRLWTGPKQTQRTKHKPAAEHPRDWYTPQRKVEEKKKMKGLCPLGLKWIVAHGFQDLLRAAANPAVLTTVSPFTCPHRVRFTAVTLVKFKNSLCSIQYVYTKWCCEYKVALIFGGWGENTLYLPETTSVPSSSKYSFTFSGRGSITLEEMWKSL